MSRRLRGDEGTVTAMVAVLALALVMVAGLAYDGGQIVAAQATARDLAANAARAGAQEIDLAELRTSGEVVLDPGAAATAAESYLADSGHSGSARVDGDSVTVTVEVQQDMRILPIADRTVRATDTATAATGDLDRG